MQSPGKNYSIVKLRRQGQFFQLSRRQRNQLLTQCLQSVRLAFALAFTGLQYLFVIVHKPAAE